MKRAMGLAASWLIVLGAPAMAAAPKARAKTETAVFAGGCFWCMEPPFDALKGVLRTTSGYTGGTTASPTYEEVSSGRTGHAEAVEIEFDPAAVTYERLLEVFWRQVDPTTPDAQFCDHGPQYRSAVYRGEGQKRAALASKEKIEKSRLLRKPIVTEITAAGAFYPAEEYHQDYYKKNPLRYKFYRANCGRDRTLEKIWGPAPR